MFKNLLCSEDIETQLKAIIKLLNIDSKNTLMIVIAGCLNNIILLFRLLQKHEFEKKKKFTESLTNQIYQLQAEINSYSELSVNDREQEKETKHYHDCLKNILEKYNEIYN